MNISAKLQQVVVPVDDNRLIAPLVKMADPLVAPIKRGRVADIKMAHELRQIALRRRYDQMKMIAHEHVGMNINLINLQRILKLLNKSRAVRVVSVDRSPLVTAARDMIIPAGN